MFADIALFNEFARLSQVLGQATFHSAEKYLPKGEPACLSLESCVATYCGSDSPLSQVCGLQTEIQLGSNELDIIEQFFAIRQSTTTITIGPFSHKETWELLFNRGYKITGHENLLYLDLSEASLKASTGIQIEQDSEGNRELIAETITKGFFENPTLEMQLVSDILCGIEGMTSFLARIGTEPTGAANLYMMQGAALLSGMSTIPKYRRKGVQLALIYERLLFSKNSGCHVAFATTTPGSGSQRNMERAGFRVLCTSSIFQRNMPK